MTKIEDKFDELLNAQTLDHDERKFIFDVNSWKIKLDFLEHSKIIKQIKDKQKAFENINNKKEMILYIEDRIEDKTNSVDYHESEIRDLENDIEKYKDILKTLNSL